MKNPDRVILQIRVRLGTVLAGGPPDSWALLPHSLPPWWVHSGEDITEYIWTARVPAPAQLGLPISVPTHSGG